MGWLSWHSFGSRPRDYGYGNQLNLWAVRRRRQRYERPLLFALAFNNVFDDR